MLNEYGPLKSTGQDCSFSKFHKEAGAILEFDWRHGNP